MDPQAFIKVSVGSLGLRVRNDTKTSSLSHPPCVCEIRLPGFPVQTSSVPFVSSPPDVVNTTIASRFYLQECDVKALLAPGGCFYAPHNPCLEIVVFADNKGCGGVVGAKRQQIGMFKLVVGPEWGRGKPALLFNGWIGIGKNKELHLKVKLDPDPRYIFQFQDKTKLSPQIVQLKGNIKQPIFSCMFSRGGRVVPQVDPVKSFWSTPFCSSEVEIEERRERKGWKVKIHDLSGSAVAAAFITTPFVPSPGCDWVTRSNPGSWLIVHPDGDSWQPWGKLEAWREQHGIRDSICCRFHLLCNDSQRRRDFVMPEILISAERGGEFFIDTDKISAERGGFVMSCRVQGEGRCSKPLVQLAKRYVKCVEDAATFVALSAAVDLSIEACKPFPKRLRLTTRHSW